MTTKSFNDDEVYPEDLIELARLNERSRLNRVPPSFSSKLRTALSSFALGTGTLWRSKDLGIDMSDYQPKVNWDGLSGKIKYVIYKSSEVPDSWKTTDPANWIQKGFSDACQACYDRNIPFSGYNYLNTAYYVKNNGTVGSWEAIDAETDPDTWASNVFKNDLNVYITVRSWVMGGGDWVNNPSNLKSAAFKRVYSWWGDLERWYMSTGDWLTNGENAAKVGSVWINLMAGKWAYRMKRLMQLGYIPTVPVGFYTRKSFITAYSPEFGVGTAGQNEVWNAGWYWSTNPTVVTTIEGIRDQLGTIPDTWRPGMWGKDPTSMIQVSGDRFKIPEITNLNGVPVGIDVNVWWHPTLSVNQFMNFKPKPVACPAGSHWDEAQQKCVPDVVVPPTDIEQRLVSLETRMSSIEGRVDSLTTGIQETKKSLEDLTGSVRRAGQEMIK